MAKTRVALALGSGGARGYAHIGAIQVIRERGLKVVALSGASMGALVGGLAAAGRLEDYATWVSGLRRSDLLRLVDPSWSAPGAISAERVLGEVAELIGDTAIEDLKVPFTAVATDLAARREVWFQRGPLHAAIRASIAIPGIITPVLINGRLLVDGGLMNPVPIEPLAGVDADLTVAISLAGPRAPLEPASPSKESTAPQRLEVWRDRLRRTLASVTGGPDDEPEDAEQRSRSRRARSKEVREVEAAAQAAFQELPPGLKISDVTALSFDAMQGLITRYRMAGLPPDVLVTVPVSAARSLDFHRAAELIELGRELTGQALDEAGY
ncbi:MAG: patatin-like phospholipase family protein [Nocardioidaceae bacterium]